MKKLIIKNRFKNIVLILFLVLSIENLNAQLYLKNESSETISVCIGWYQESSSGYVTKGWWNIEPGQTISPGLSFTKLNDEFYYCAKSATRTWGSEYNLLIRDDAFEIKDAQSEETLKNNPSYEWASFNKMNVSFGLLEERTFTLTFEKSEEDIQKEYTRMNKTYYNSDGDALVISEFSAIGFNYKLIFNNSHDACLGMDDFVGFATNTGEIFKGSSDCSVNFSFESKVIIVEPEYECVGRDCAIIFDGKFSVK